MRVATPRSVVVSVGTPTAQLPASPITIASAARRSPDVGTKLSRPPVRLLLGPLGEELDAAAEFTFERSERRQVRHRVAFAVGRAAAVPAAVALRQLEGRTLPLSLAERRLDVVVAVQEDGRRALGPGCMAEDGRVAVGHVEQAGVWDACIGDRVADVLGRLDAALGRVLGGVGDARDRDQSLEIGAGPWHEPADPLAHLLACHALDSLAFVRGRLPGRYRPPIAIPARPCH